MTSSLPPCVLHEDDHLLVVEKPTGWNTHAPAPYAGEGIYDWLRHREPRWAGLAIIHRLDKDTAGVLVFAKTPLASKSLTDQFTRRLVDKRYRLLTARRPPRDCFRAESRLVRSGDHYRSQAGGGGELAITEFSTLRHRADGTSLVEARPLTGRTHQIRVHAAENGFPILGDTLYGGSPAIALALQAVELSFLHPASDQPVTFRSRTDFLGEHSFDEPRKQQQPQGRFVVALSAASTRRAAIIEPGETDCFRLIHSVSDGSDFAGQYLDQWGQHLLWSTNDELAGGFNRDTATELRAWAASAGFRGVYARVRRRAVRDRAGTDTSPQWAGGERVEERLVVRENAVRYEVSFAEGYSVGLFLDQRDNRRRLLTNHIAADFSLRNGGLGGGELLNVFAYTCAFSVCAALVGARTTSLDLSKKYLDWGRRNFALNSLDPAGHDFIFGDAFDWLRRLAKKSRTFDAVLLDPPTFSTSKECGRWQAEQDYGRLVTAALPLVKPGGVLLASTNASRLTPEEFVATVRDAIAVGGRRTSKEHYVPQPPDFPISKAEPAYLKTIWLRLA